MNKHEARLKQIDVMSRGEMNADVKEYYAAERAKVYAAQKEEARKRSVLVERREELKQMRNEAESMSDKLLLSEKLVEVELKIEDV